MEFRVENRRPRRTWLESIEVHMAELKLTKNMEHVEIILCPKLGNISCKNIDLYNSTSNTHTLAVIHGIF